MIQKQIVKKLTAVGIDPADIDFRGTNGETKFFRYRYWKTLPDEAFESIKDLVIEDCYDDNDGDDDKGRPIIRHLYSYQFKNI